MFILALIDENRKVVRRCSIVVFDTNEKTNTFFFKQRLDDAEWESVHFKSYSIFDSGRPYPIIEVTIDDER